MSDHAIDRTPTGWTVTCTRPDGDPCGWTRKASDMETINLLLAQHRGDHALKDARDALPEGTR